MQFIGATSDTLEGYHFFNGSGEEIAGSGFGLEDFYQDIDSYNIARSYDLSKVKIYEAINDYYFGSVFEKVFGDFTADGYGEILAQSFEAKINNLIISEPAQ